jgi:DNA polymerase-1
MDKKVSMDIKRILHPADLMPYMEKLTAAKVLAVDTETTGLDPHTCQLRLIQLATEDLPVLVIDCFSFLPDGRELIKSVLSASGVKVFQNAKFDLQFLMTLDIFPPTIFDTMLAAQLLRGSGGPAQSNLKMLAQHYLNEDLNKEEQTSNWQGELTESQILYAARDAEILLRLRKVMIPQILENHLTKIAEIEFRCVKAMAHLEYRGIYLDRQKWQELYERTEKDRKAALDELYTYVENPLVQMSLWGEDVAINQNFESQQFVLNVLQDHGITVEATAKQDLYPHRHHPLVKALISYRKAAKSISAFLEPFTTLIHPVTGRLHPRYGQISAWSGRMSCWNPNVQQIPRDSEFRACFAAPPGRKLILADYSQIELRVAAQISGDARMISAYQKGEDLHLLTASLVANKPMEEITSRERQAAKAVNFGLIFGMGAPGLKQYAQQNYGVEMSLEQATEFRERFFKSYTGISRWHQSIKAHLPKEGRTLTGRKFVYYEKAGLPGYYNTPVQGTAADIVKKALGLLVERLAGTDTYIVGIVHDEILLECSAEKAEAVAELLRGTMEEAANSILPRVPTKVDVVVSGSWAEK